MKLNILHTNDLHDRFPKTSLEKLKQEPYLLIDSGDAIGGSNLVFRRREPILHDMSQIGYHAMAMGNREFHYVRSILSSRMKTASFPILSSNVVDLRKQLPLVDQFFVTFGELKIGMFGLTVPQYPIASNWEMITGWRFFDPIETALEISERLRRAGAMLVFCLSHLGFKQDQLLAKQVDGIDCIFGGHSHTILPSVYWVGKTAIVQGGAYGHFIGKWTLDAAMQNGSVMQWTLNGELVKTL